MRPGDAASIARGSAECDEGRALMRRLDEELHERYPTASVHGFDPRAIAGGRGVFVIARVGGEAVGCGAVRPHLPGVGEIKRMYVVPEHRGRGIARAILAALEAAAQELSFGTLRLETGPRQAEAIRLYESAGFVAIPPYGEYVGDPFSVCYEKRLAQP